LTIRTAGSIQWNAVAETTASNGPSGSSQVSKSAATTSTAPNPARFRWATAAMSAPSSTAVIRQPRSASG